MFGVPDQVDDAGAGDRREIDGAAGGNVSCGVTQVGGDAGPIPTVVPNTLIDQAALRNSARR